MKKIVFSIWLIVADFFGGSDMFVLWKEGRARRVEAHLV